MWLGTWGAGRIVVAMLTAADGQAVEAAVAEGRQFDEHARWGVAMTLRKLRDNAEHDYPPAWSLADGLCRAWAARWGEERPQPATR